MNTAIFILSAVVLGLVIIAKLPGLEYVVKPVIDLAFKALAAVLENMVSWTIWLFKSLLDAHLGYLMHLTRSAESIDPTITIKQNEG